MVRQYPIIGPRFEGCQRGTLIGRRSIGNGRGDKVRGYGNLTREEVGFGKDKDIGRINRKFSIMGQLKSRITGLV